MTQIFWGVVLMLMVMGAWKLKKEVWNWLCNLGDRTNPPSGDNRN